MRVTQAAAGILSGVACHSDKLLSVAAKSSNYWNCDCDLVKQQFSLACTWCCHHCSHLTWTWPVTYFCQLQSSKDTECCLYHICNSDGQWEICQSTTSVHCGQTNPAVLTSNSWSLCCAAISICFFNGMPDAHFVEPSWLFGDSDVISNSFLIFSANQGCDLQWEGPPLRGESPTS